jgi:glycosyltransferase involved in cell wall biosynthesis
MRVLIYEPTGWGSHFYYVKSLWQQLVSLAEETAEITVLSCSDCQHPAYSNALIKLKYEGRFDWPLLGRILRKLDRLWKISLNYWRLGRYIRKRRIDIVHFQVLHKIYLPYLTALKWLIGFKIVFTPHNIRSHYTGKVIHNTLDLLFFKCFKGVIDCCVAHTLYHHQQLMLQGISADRIAVIPFAPHMVGKADSSRREYDSVLFAGNLRKNKGIDFFLDALSILAQRLKDADRAVKIWFAGRTRDQDIIGRIERLKGNARNLEIDFDNRYIDHTAFGNYFNRAFILVLPYTQAFHSLSAVLLDGYYYDNELIVTDVAGNGELVKADDTGYLISPENAPQIAEKIYYALRAGPNKYFSRNKRKALRKKYNWPTIARQTMEVYKTVCREMK